MKTICTCGLTIMLTVDASIGTQAQTLAQIYPDQ